MITKILDLITNLISCVIQGTAAGCGYSIPVLRYDPLCYVMYHMSMFLQTWEHQYLHDLNISDNSMYFNVIQLQYENVLFVQLEF